eukprot:scaffold139975_cov127-Phaeocystis_antarctica.AAC.5
MFLAKWARQRHDVLKLLATSRPIERVSQMCGSQPVACASLRKRTRTLEHLKLSLAGPEQCYAHARHSHSAADGVSEVRLHAIHEPAPPVRERDEHAAVDCIQPAEVGERLQARHEAVQDQDGRAARRPPPRLALTQGLPDEPAASDLGRLRASTVETPPRPSCRPLRSVALVVALARCCVAESYQHSAVVNIICETRLGYSRFCENVLGHELCLPSSSSSEFGDPTERSERREAT